MSIRDVTRVVSSSSAPADDLAALLGSTSCRELAGLLVDVFQLGMRAARLRAVCDWCGEPVVVAVHGWCHQATALYGCEPERLWGQVAQVDGSTSPTPAPELPDLASLRPTTHGEGCECPACLWQRLGANERRDISAAIDRRQVERHSVDRRGGDRGWS